MTKTKPKKTFYTIMGIIGDIVFIPIMILSFVVCSIIFFTRSQNSIPSVFGVSMVKILSGSMRKSGFEVGDTVFVVRTDSKKIWEGDIIAFYEKYDLVDKNAYNVGGFLRLDDKNQNIESRGKVYSGRSTRQEAIDSGARVIFHQVIGVYADENGTRFFETQGTSVGHSDGLIREDFLVGRYSETSKNLRGVIKWISSPMGMVTLVCLPLGVLVILQSLSLIEQINFMILEKKLLERKISLKDKEVERFIAAGEMQEIAKIIYLGTEKEEVEKAYTKLWEHIPNKDKKYAGVVQKSYEILTEKGREAYFTFWQHHLEHLKDIERVQDELYRIEHKDKE